MKVLDLFSGIGGCSLGLERAGMKTVAFCEIEKFPRKVLKKHWPDVPIYEDIRELTFERLQADSIGPIDLVAGGFPCQDISVSKPSGLGLDGDSSGLWSEYKRLISEIRPTIILVENVAALLVRGMGRILGDLSTLGYDAEWDTFQAAALGMCHSRNRVWIVAFPKGKRWEFSRKIKNRILNQELGSWGFRENFERIHGQALQLIPIASDRGTVNEIPNIVDRNTSIGNSVCPDVVEVIGRAIMEIDIK